MALQGPIIIIEDDENDASVITDAITELGISNECKVMHSAQEGHNYLMTTTDKPFVILCDIRMPATDGLAFRKAIMTNEFLHRKSIPFVFFTNMVSAEIVNSAYDLDVQGFYQKANSYEGIKEQLLTILMYWKQSLHPNRF